MDFAVYPKESFSSSFPFFLSFFFLVGDVLEVTTVIDKLKPTMEPRSFVK